MMEMQEGSGSRIGCQLSSAAPISGLVSVTATVGRSVTEGNIEFKVFQLGLAWCGFKTFWSLSI